MKTKLIFLSLFFSLSTLATESNCLKRWKVNYAKVKEYELLSAKSTQTLCGYTVRSNKNDFEIIVSQDIKKSILPNNKNLNDSCEHTAPPIDNVWSFCNVGVFSKIVSHKNEKIIE